MSPVSRSTCQADLVSERHAESADEVVIRQLAVRYARAIDRNEPELLGELFTPDAVIEGPGFLMNGLDEIRKVPGMLRKMYSFTIHVVHQQTVMISGDSAESETYCTANHLMDQGEGKASNLIWSIRYQDSIKRRAGAWRFARRMLIIDWTETRAVAIARN